jgi:hypothetical protein
MKTNYFKKIMVPALVAVFGISCAFTTTSAAGSKALIDKMGYRFVSAADPCHATKICSTSLGQICKYGNIQLWGRLDENDHQCVEVVYERP